MNANYEQILNDATNWGPEADRLNRMLVSLFGTFDRMEVQLLAASRVIKSFINYDAILLEFPVLDLENYGVYGLLVANIETGTLWQFRTSGWVNTGIVSISGDNYNKFEIAFSDNATPDITNYQTTFALVFGQIPTVKLWIGSDETTWVLDGAVAQIDLQGGLINRIYFDYGSPITGKIIIS